MTTRQHTEAQAPATPIAVDPVIEPIAYRYDRPVAFTLAGLVTWLCWVAAGWLSHRTGQGTPCAGRRWSRPRWACRPGRRRRVAHAGPAAAVGRRPEPAAVAGGSASPPRPERPAPAGEPHGGPGDPLLFGGEGGSVPVARPLSFQLRAAARLGDPRPAPVIEGTLRGTATAPTPSSPGCACSPRRWSSVFWTVWHAAGPGRRLLPGAVGQQAWFDALNFLLSMITASSR